MLIQEYKRSLELSALDSKRISKIAMNAGYEIAYPEKVGDLWLGKRLLACYVTIISNSFSCFL